MLTAIRAVENIIDGAEHDLWEVNAESVYHEEHEEPEQPYRRAPETRAMREPLVPAERGLSKAVRRRRVDVCPMESRGLRWNALWRLEGV